MPPKAPKKTKEEKREDRLYDPSRFVKLSKLVDFVRIPTDFAALDLYTLGGIPAATTSLISGANSTGKTNLGIKIIVGFQRLFPDEKVLYGNVDNKLDPAWARTLGANLDTIEEFTPSSSDEAHDILYNVTNKRHDIGLVLVDSLAALSPENEIIGHTEMGLAASLNNKFFRKMGSLQLDRKRLGKPLTFIVINQERMSMSGTYPVPIVPGGAQQRYQAGWIKFMSADSIIDKPTGIPIATNMRYRLEKNQGGANKWTGETFLVTTPHGKYAPGDILDQEFVFLWRWRLGLRDKEEKKIMVARWEDDKAAYRIAKQELLVAFKEWIAMKRPANFIKEENLVTVSVGGTDDERELAVS